MAMEWTFLMIKPDAVDRGLIGKIISRFEAKGLTLVGMKMVWPTKELLEKHYEDLKDEPHFNGLVEYMSKGPVIPMVWEGPDAVTIGRVLIGVKDPVLSTPGSIRGDFANRMPQTVVHGARTPEDAERELALWFKNDGSGFVYEDLLGTEEFDHDDAGSDTGLKEKDDDASPAADGVSNALDKASKSALGGKAPVMPSEQIHPIDHTRRVEETG